MKYWLIVSFAKYFSVVFGSKVCQVIDLHDGKKCDAKTQTFSSAFGSVMLYAKNPATEKLVINLLLLLVQIPEFIKLLRKWSVSYR